MSPLWENVLGISKSVPLHFDNIMDVSKNTIFIWVNDGDVAVRIFSSGPGQVSDWRVTRSTMFQYV